MGYELRLLLRVAQQKRDEIQLCSDAFSFLITGNNNLSFLKRVLILKFEILLAELTLLDTLLKSPPSLRNLNLVLCDFSFIPFQLSKKRFSHLEPRRVEVLTHEVDLFVKLAGKLVGNVLVGNVFYYSPESHLFIE